jgi:hypothetical protein
VCSSDLNRMGQLIYDNLFWNKITKDLGMISVRSLGWNLGTFRELGGGAFDIVKQPIKAVKGERPELTYRASYTIALPLVIGILGAITQYLFTGKGPDEIKDYFFPKTGKLDKNGDPERMSLPSYMKDLYHYYTKPGQTLINKLNPAIHLVAEMLQNKDFYGVKIRNEDDPMITQAKDLLAHGVKGFEPFASRNIRREMELTKEPGIREVTPFFGVTPAPGGINKTKAEELADEIAIGRMPRGARTKESFEKSKVRSELLRGLRVSGDREAVKEALRTGKITESDASSIATASKQKPFDVRIKPLSVPELMRIWDIANDGEKAKLRPLIASKYWNWNAPRDERDKFREKVKEVRAWKPAQP